MIVVNYKQNGSLSYKDFFQLFFVDLCCNIEAMGSFL